MHRLHVRIHEASEPVSSRVLVCHPEYVSNPEAHGDRNQLNDGLLRHAGDSNHVWLLGRSHQLSDAKRPTRECNRTRTWLKMVDGLRPTLGAAAQCGISLMSSTIA